MDSNLCAGTLGRSLADAHTQAPMDEGWSMPIPSDAKLCRPPSEVP